MSIKIYCDKCQREFKEVKENVRFNDVLLKAGQFTFKISLIENKHLCKGCLKELIASVKVIFQKPKPEIHKK